MPDPTERIDAYYDFMSPANLSYGIQIPFGPPSTRAFDGNDNRMIIAADKGPYITADVQGPPPGLNYEDSKLWRPYNTPHHSRDGQSVLFADGHADFVRVPTAGVDYDNIYTVALDNYFLPSRTIGELPWVRGLLPQSSTDSVIFP